MPASLQRLPPELLYSITLNIPLSSLNNLIASSRRAFSELHALTIRSPSFVPWRRRYEAHSRAYKRVHDEAELRAYLRKQRDTEADTITSSAAQTGKSVAEREYEAVLSGYLADFGFENPYRGSWQGGERFLKLGHARLFQSLHRLWTRAAGETNGTLPPTPTQTKLRKFLRLKKLGCELSVLRRRLDRICDARALGGLVPEGPSQDQETPAIYYLLTAYLLYTSLTPDEIPGIVEACTPPALREELREDDRASICEFFCYLALFLDIWDEQEGMFLPDMGEQVPQAEPVVGEELFGESSRRLLNGRLRYWIEKRFAPPKPLLPPAVCEDEDLMMDDDDFFSDCGEWIYRDPRMNVVIPLRPKPRSGTVAAFGFTPTPNSTAPVAVGRTGPLQRTISLPTQMIVDEPAEDTLTEEQRRVVETDISSGELMKVRAYAGTGKTRSLVEYAKTRPFTKFLYVAFNKNAQVDAQKKFGFNVDCKTMHSVALRCLPTAAPIVAASRDAGKIQIPKGSWGTKELTQFLKLDRVKTIISVLASPTEHNIPADREEKTPRRRKRFSQAEGTQSLRPFPTATSVATTVKVVLERFWCSTDAKIKDFHLPLNMITTLGLNQEVIKGWATKIWNDIVSGEGEWLPHDAYLKLMAINPGSDMEAFGRYNVIFMDEAQDNNACMADLILRQRLNGLGVIVVGDPYQKIYGFRGAGNDCFDDAKFPSTHTVYLTHSFRFGDAIAACANVLLRALKEPVPVNGVQRQDSLHRSITHTELFGSPSSLTSRRVLTTTGDLLSDTVSQPFTIIFRKNVTLVSYALSFSISHPTYKLHLRIQRAFNKSSLFSTLRYAYDLFHNNRRAPSGPLREWKTWADLKAHVEASEAFDDSPLLALVVALESKLAEKTFTDDLAAVEANVLEESDADNADVTLITAHQAKGLEWDRVHVADDFGPDYSNREKLAKSKYFQEEMGLLYVAVTRARKELIIEHPVVEWIAAERGVCKSFIRTDPRDFTDCERCGKTMQVKVVTTQEGMPDLKSFSTVRIDEYGGDVGFEAEVRVECFWCCADKVQALKSAGQDEWKLRNSLDAAWETVYGQETARVIGWLGWQLEDQQG